MAGEKKFELPSQKYNGRRNSIDLFRFICLPVTTKNYNFNYLKVLIIASANIKHKAKCSIQSNDSKPKILNKIKILLFAGAY